MSPSTAARLELLGRPGCCLCDEAETALRALEREYRIEIVKINVDDDADLQARYGDGVPVLRAEGRTWARHRIELETIRRKLDTLGVRRDR